MFQLFLFALRGQRLRSSLKSPWVHYGLLLALLIASNADTAAAQAHGPHLPQTPGTFDDFRIYCAGERLLGLLEGNLAP